MSISLISLHIGRVTCVSSTVTAHGAWVRGAHWVSAVQPKHVCIVVIPQRHHENHACVNGLLDGVQSALLQEIRAILGGCNPISAKLVSDGVVGLAVDSVRWVLNGPALLLVELPHLRELAVIGAIVGDELRSHGDGLCAVN